jgi:penicillin-binding protein 2
MKYKRKHQDSRSRQITMVMLVLVVCVLFIVRLFSLQVLDDTYKDSAESNAFLRKTIYPSRGLIYDRNGKLMVSNQPVYDVMVVLREMANFDTLAFCQVMGITKMDFEERMADIKNRRKNPGYSRYTPQVFIPQISYQDYGLLQEKLFRFPGIFVQQRVSRQYTLPSAALQIGSLGEVTQKQLEADAYYKRGDHKGQ